MLSQESFDAVRRLRRLSDWQESIHCMARHTLSQESSHGDSWIDRKASITERDATLSQEPSDTVRRLWRLSDWQSAIHRIRQHMSQSATPCCCRRPPMQSGDCGDSRIDRRPSIALRNTMSLQEFSNGDSKIGNRPSTESGNTCCRSRRTSSQLRAFVNMDFNHHQMVQHCVPTL